jgi:hypothetical protein
MASEARGPIEARWRGQTRPAPPVPVWASWPPSLNSCALEGSHDKILTSEKSQAKLSSGRFLYRQNTQNRVSVLQSYNQNKGDR